MGDQVVKRFFLYVLAASAGLLAGPIVGAIAGIVATAVFHTSQFEGYAGYLVFTTFMPLGALVGLLAGPFLLAWRLRRRDASKR
ncbi:MAG: hypothetical protein KDJ25_00120 [Rhodoblastus sp.]|nr:hypothetical protein [Rhodoblastus sp.]